MTFERHRSAVERAVRDEGNYHSEFRIIRPDTGEVAWLEEWAEVRRDDSGNAAGMVGVAMDVTQRKRAEAERERLLTEVQTANSELSVASLRNQQLADEYGQQVRQMNALLGSLREGVTIVDREGQIVLRNHASRDLFGISEEDRDARQLRFLSEVLGEDGKPLPMELRPILRAARGEQLVDEEATVLRPTAPVAGWSTPAARSGTSTVGWNWPWSSTGM